MFKNKTVRVGAIILVSVIFALIGASEYFLHYALARGHEKYDLEREFSELKADFPWIEMWVDSIRSTGELRDTVIRNDNGLEMHGWYLSSSGSTGNTAVVVHGYTSNPIEMMQIGYMYNHDFGWNVLLPDLPAHGQSEGETIQMGWLDRIAVQQWIEVAHDVFEADTMVVHGISMGAATTMCVAGDPSPDYVRGFIEDCGYTSVWDEFKGELKAQFGLPAFPLLHITSGLCKLQNGWSFTEASPLEQVRKCEKPMLFIHGDADTYVPTAMVYQLFESATCPKQMWIAPGSAHADAYKDHSKDYSEVVDDFINNYIN